MDRSIDVPDFHLKCGFFIVNNSNLTARQNRTGLDPLHDCSKIFFGCHLTTMVGVRDLDGVLAWAVWIT